MVLSRDIGRALWRLRRRVLLACSRGLLRLVDDTPRTQTLQAEGYRGEVIDGVEHLQGYGLTVHPRRGALVLLLALGGMRQHTVAAAAVDPEARPTGLAEGEVCLYTHLDGGGGGPHRVHLREDGSIAFRAGRTTLRIADGGMELVCPSGTQTWGSP